MLLPEHFQNNDILRTKLASASSVIDQAFEALSNLDELTMKVDDTNALANSNRLAELAGVAKFKSRFRALMKAPHGDLPPVPDNYASGDAYDQIARDAEAKAADSENK